MTAIERTFRFLAFLARKGDTCARHMFSSSGIKWCRTPLKLQVSDHASRPA
jgi:hypothetical protein